jgi:hypothetical protein
MRSPKIDRTASYFFADGEPPPEPEKAPIALGGGREDPTSFTAQALVRDRLHVYRVLLHRAAPAPRKLSLDDEIVGKDVPARIAHDRSAVLVSDQIFVVVG